MAVIERNKYGAIAVNKGVIDKMIIEDLNEMSGRFVLCNKKGKIIKDNPTPWLDPDQYDAIDVSDKRGETKINIYLISKFGVSISKLADEIFTSVEEVFEVLRLPKPAIIKINVKGIMFGHNVGKRNIEVVRKNV